MSATKKPNPPSAETARALDDARAMRQKRTATRDVRIRKMSDDGVSQAEIANELDMSRDSVQKSLARTRGTP